MNTTQDRREVEGNDARSAPPQTGGTTMLGEAQKTLGAGALQRKIQRRATTGATGVIQRKEDPAKADAPIGAPAAAPGLNGMLTATTNVKLDGKDVALAPGTLVEVVSKVGTDKLHVKVYSRHNGAQCDIPVANFKAQPAVAHKDFDPSGARQDDVSFRDMRGPLFGALIAMLRRPYMVPVIVFVLVFKLGDASMGFMVKPFWVDAGFTPAQIGLVSVNIGLALSIAGGLAGGWYVDRAGVFKGLWVLGLWQAASNLGYVAAASVLPLDPSGASIQPIHRAVLYAASATESFTGGLGTAAFLAFLMSIVDKRASATEYALLSSVFALSRSVAGWASGFGAAGMGYAPYFLLTFFLSFPAYVLLPWVRRVIESRRA